MKVDLKPSLKGPFFVEEFCINIKRVKAGDHLTVQMLSSELSKLYAFCPQETYTASCGFSLACVICSL